MSNEVIIDSETTVVYDALTSEREIKRIFSTDGVINHLEDMATYTTHMNEVIGRASEKVLMYLRGIFSMEDMMVNPWVREKASYIACYLISIRTGNPSLYGAMYEEALIELTQVRNGQLNPGMRREVHIITHTPMVDNRGWRPGLRTDPSSSTSPHLAKKPPIRYFHDR
jgi:hypothetical protein